MTNQIKELKQQYQELREKAGVSDSSEDWQKAGRAAKSVSMAISISRRRSSNPKTRQNKLNENTTYISATHYCSARHAEALEREAQQV